MPAHMVEETRYVRSKVHLPIYADEACTDVTMIPKLVDAYDGINVKLDKAGGILESLRWIEVARAMKMKIMLGCMVSSSCSVTAAAHLSPLVDYADLDGNLLVANDPWAGVRRKRKTAASRGPGIGPDGGVKRGGSFLEVFAMCVVDVFGQSKSWLSKVRGCRLPGPAGSA
jgi:L-alanine-DL-glutamate epimerase-like enolase superfamily enzyme